MSNRYDEEIERDEFLSRIVSVQLNVSKSSSKKGKQHNLTHPNSSKIGDLNEGGPEEEPDLRPAGTVAVPAKKAPLRFGALTLPDDWEDMDPE